ncbi:hypothetical protein N7470_001618 [Penicillium chermesinum]|nr:hypothetical protein N7470_001618 [Penicillium chermesinum]
MAAIIASHGQTPYRMAQEREFWKYFPFENSTSRYAPFDDASSNNFVPASSKDATLNSFAQLGATRLGAERCIISLFDRTQQHILAEATPTLSLIGGRTAHGNEKLLLGCCVFPKERGLCQQATAPQSKDHSKEDNEEDKYSVFSLDITQDNRFNPTKLVSALSSVRFFAAVPIISPRGFLIGSFCVMDSKPRTSGPDRHTFQYMKDAAATTMEYLETKETAHRSRRAEKMIVGLGSFVEGRSTLRDSWWEAKAQHDAAETSGQSAEGQLNMEQQDLQHISKESGMQALPIRDAPKKKDIDGQDRKTARRTPRHSRHNSGESDFERENRGKETQSGRSQKEATTRSVLAGDRLQDESLPSSIRNIFSRAANLIREAISAEGVMFLDADTDTFGNLVENNKRTVRGTGRKDTTSSSDESTDSSSSRHDGQARRADSGGEEATFSECLGFSSSRLSSINDEERAGEAIRVPQPLFSSLIRRYPRGKIFTYNANGSVSEDSDDPTKGVSGSDQDRTSANRDSRAGSSRRQKPFRQDADTLVKIFSGARNILLLPIWNSDKNRWFAGAIVWTNQPDRIFTFQNELVYISAFTNSIMAEIRRVDVEVAEKAKTNLVSSITHELRNPLHGILGTADILSDTAMNALQYGMVHTIESCGRTLLDTINNLLDLTFIDQYRKDPSSRVKANGKRKPSIPQSLPGGEKSSFTRVTLDSVLEEVTECVFAGYCFYNHPQAPPPALTESSSRTAGQASKAAPAGPRANQVTVIFDIEPHTEWDFYTHPGAWRRILMNVFGNALKYTSSGYIYIGLKSSQSSRSQKRHQDEFNVTITVKDTGKGISPAYLQKDLFTPFMQEDPPCIWKWIGFEYLYSSLRKHTEDKKIAFLGFGTALVSQRDTGLYNSLDRMCREWFGMKVTNLSPLRGRHAPFDFYLAVQTELDCEDVGGRNLFELPAHFDGDDSCKAPVVVICQTPEEAHRMFVSAKNRGSTTSFEFVSQPCGPRKLARALDLCIKRRMDEESGQSPSEEPTRWVEMPESTHLPVDFAPIDPPEERLKIQKRPTKDTIGKDEESPNLGSPREYLDGDGDGTGAQRRQDADADQTPAAPEQSSEKDGGGPQPREKCVLLVDDNDLNLQLLCAYAKKENFTYTSGKNGAEAVDLYKADPGKFQVVILASLDISMPVMDGFEASRQIRRAEKEFRSSLSESERKVIPPLIIAALTGLDSSDAQKEALGSGINTFLIKPIKRPQLQAVLRREV